MININKIIQIVLSNDFVYGGEHQSSSERTKITLPLLPTNIQLNLIFKEFCSYLLNNLKQKKSIYIPNFGIFTFKYVNNINVKDNYNFTKTFTNYMNFNNKMIIFILDKKFHKILNKINIDNKNVLLQPKNLGEIKNLIEWNAYLISKKLFLKMNVIEDGINSIIKCIYDLVESKNNIEIDFGFCKIIFKNQEFIFINN